MACARSRSSFLAGESLPTSRRASRCRCRRSFVLGGYIRIRRPGSKGNLPLVPSGLALRCNILSGRFENFWAERAAGPAYEPCSSVSDGVRTAARLASSTSARGPASPTPAAITAQSLKGSSAPLTMRLATRAACPQRQLWGRQPHQNRSGLDHSQQRAIRAVVGQPSTKVSRSPPRKPIARVKLQPSHLRQDDVVQPVWSRHLTRMSRHGTTMRLQ